MDHKTVQGKTNVQSNSRNTHLPAHGRPMGDHRKLAERHTGAQSKAVTQLNFRPRRVMKTDTCIGAHAHAYTHEERRHAHTQPQNTNAKRKKREEGTEKGKPLRTEYVDNWKRFHLKAPHKKKYSLRWAQYLLLPKMCSKAQTKSS